MPELDEAVITYVDVAGRIFQQAQQHAQPQSAIRVLRRPSQLLRGAVLEAEESEAFVALVRAVMEAYGPTHPAMYDTESAITSFFYRSGTYRSQFSGESISPRAVTDSLQCAFSATTHRVKYLAPLEYVSFGAEVVNCGSFQIRKYSRQQLDDLLENDMRAMFSQRLRIDTAALEPYWYIVVDGTEPHPLCDYSNEDLDSSRPVEFSPYPQVLDKALRRFALFNWNQGFGIRDYEPQIPFVITISDSPIVPPEDPPDMRRLFMMQGIEGEDPVFVTNLNESRTLDFSRRMQHIDRLFEAVSVRHEQWRFIEVAAGFLLKGYLTRGLESLLWNVASIEAVLGERGAGLTRVLSVRLSRILGTDEEHKGIRKLFEEIYNFRSAVVHGDARTLERTDVESQGIEARNLACLLLMWMLSWLADVAERWEQTSLSLPTRKQLLAVLDLMEGDLDTVAKLLGALPCKFPHVPAWLDPGKLGERWRAEDAPSQEEVAAAKAAFAMPKSKHSVAPSGPKEGQSR